MNKKQRILLLASLIILTFFIVFSFPSINTKLRINFYDIKNTLYSPLNFLSNKASFYYNVFKSNSEKNFKIIKLKQKIHELEEVNLKLSIQNAKLNELNFILNDLNSLIPISVGAEIIGNKNFLINNYFIINKGSNSGITLGSYVISNNHVIGRVKTVERNASEVVSVVSSSYGDEVIINNQSYIVSGTDLDHLLFKRKKDSTKEFKFKFNEKVMIKTKNSNHLLQLGTVKYLKTNFIVKPTINIKSTNVRILLDD